MVKFVQSCDSNIPSRSSSQRKRSSVSGSKPCWTSLEPGAPKTCDSSTMPKTLTNCQTCLSTPKIMIISPGEKSILPQETTLWSNGVRRKSWKSSLKCTSCLSNLTSSQKNKTQNLRTLMTLNLFRSRKFSSGRGWRISWHSMKSIRSFLKMGSWRTWASWLQML